MPGKTFISVLERAQDQFGFITTTDARSLGIDPAQLRIMASRGQLEHRSRGIYRLPIVPPGDLDEYMEAVLWTGNEGAVSHESALLIHDLSDVNPARIHLAVPPTFRTRKAVPTAYEIHRDDIPGESIVRSRGIPVVSAEVAIGQCISRGLARSLVDQAVDEARAKGLLDLRTARELRRMGRDEARA